MRLQIDHVSCGYGRRAVLEDVNLTVEPGEVVCVLGPNGVGKTTFFKTILGFLPPIGGAITWDGRSVSGLRNRQRAKFLAYVPQVQAPPFPYTVREVVVMGRAAHLKPFQNPTEEDYHICDETLGKLKISYLADKIYTNISGGERQMALIARALVQKPQLLMMDEPTTNLDYGNQVKVLQQVMDLAKEGFMILMTTHSPEHAAICATKVALFQKGKPAAIGKPAEIVNEENLRSAYGVDVKMFAFENSHGQEVKACVPMMA